MHFLYTIIGLFILANAQESYLPNSKNPDVPDKCFLKMTGDYIAFGSILTPVGICQKFTCRDDFVIRVDHCSRFTQPENCKEIPEDLSQPFPDCCVKLRCLETDGTETIRNTTWLS